MLGSESMASKSVDLDKIMEVAEHNSANAIVNH